MNEDKVFYTTLFDQSSIEKEMKMGIKNGN